MDTSDRVKNALKKILKILMKILKMILIKISLPLLGGLILIGALGWFLFVHVHGETWSEGSSYSSSDYAGDTSIDSDGKITTGNTVQEVWDEKKEKNGKVDLYLHDAKELAKLMNAELVTQFLDTRPNPDEPIDWKSENINDPNSKEVQGIIKLKRAYTNGNTKTITYQDPETFQKNIDEYNSSGSETAKKEALSHFTLEKTSLSSNASGQAETIEEGDTISIPSGLGSVHTYMGWQKITSTTSTQYKLREQAGMNFDEEGFGKINGRYVIACTTTFGKVGDYIDFYQTDGTIISCIIGDIKSQNDKGCTKWGHDNGHCIVEFVVDKDSWYHSGHPNPGNQGCHPEWNQNLTKAVNGGSYFNPNFGTDTVTENGKTKGANNKETMKWPTKGTNITSEYGPRNSPTEGASSNHKGIDIGVAEGTEVYACEDGKVTTATTSGTAGQYIVIDHGNGYVSKYMHNSELKVKVGKKVEKGDVIALSGNTGVSTGAHLHFQIEYDGKPIDPLTLKYDNGQGTGDGGIGSDSKNINQATTRYYAKVATWDETTDIIETTGDSGGDPEVEEKRETTYNMTTTNIDYYKFVSAYTMPFDYLWALLVIGEDKDFVLQLADLVYKSEIEITVHDNLTVTTDTKVDTYTKKTRTDTEGVVTISCAQGNTVQTTQAKENWSDEEAKNYETTNINIVKTNTLDIALTKANVWIVKYQQDYIYAGQQESVSDPIEKTLDPKNYGSKPDSTSNEDTYGHVAQFLQTKINEKRLEKENEIENQQNTDTENEENPEEDTNQEPYNVTGKIDSIHTGVYHATVDRNRKITNTIQTTQYISSPGKTIEKTDKNADEDNFVTIIRKQKCNKGRILLLKTKDWLYEILEKKETTADMIDLTKYLLYKVTDHDYGVTQYDFSIYDPANFVAVNSDAKSNLGGIQGQIADFFLEKGMSIEGISAILGNIEQDSNFNASLETEGKYHGLCQWNQKRFTELKKLAGQSNKEWTDIDVQLQFIWKELTTGGYAKVKNQLMNTTDVKKATNLFARDYAQCVRAGKNKDKKEKEARQKKAEKWQKELQEKATGGSSTTIDTSSFLATAKSCHDYVRENNYWYPSSANLAAGKFVRDGKPETHKFPTKGESPSKRYIDCSAYVSWVLKEYGYNIPSPYAFSGLLNNPLHLQTVAINNVQAGDILVRDGHTEIYCGNGKSYSCGSTKAIRAVNSSCTPSRFTKAFRVNK